MPATDNPPHDQPATTQASPVYPPLPWKRMTAAALGLYVLDQATKWAVVLNVSLGEVIPVWGSFFKLTHVTNTGMAWGMGQGNNGVFIVLCIVTMIALVILAAKGAFICRWTRTGVALLMAGVAGNLTDRLIHGHVVDFLDFTFRFGDWRYDYPTFNVADMCIVTAALLFVISSIWAPADPGTKPKAPRNAEQAG